MQQNDHTAINSLVQQFFSLFDNRICPPDLSRLSALFITPGVIIKNSGEQPEVYTLATFIEPRQRLLSDGSLSDFCEHEVDARTDVFGNIAQRVVLYHKQGVQAGKAFEQYGVKVFQFARTCDGWRIVAMSWDDERDGLPLPRRLSPKTESSVCYL